MFDKAKAEQIGAFFVMKETDKKINILKLIKLIYLTDRKNIERYGEPILDDDYFSLPHGPINSKALDMLEQSKYYFTFNNNSDSNLIKKFLDDKQDYDIPLQNNNITIDDLDELSEADIEILQEIWLEYGKMDRFELRDWTHQPENIPEWQDPKGSRSPILLKTIMEKVGVENVDEHYAEWKSLQSVMNELTHSTK